MSGPLDGVRVIALAGMGPTPFASMLLADLGADVARIVRPPALRGRGNPVTDGSAEVTDTVNRGVRSAMIDLKTADGVLDLLTLLDRADVFIEGSRPGVTERLGLGPAVLLERRPQLVYARLTGFGQDGPLAHTAGHDINYVAQSGALSMLGRPGQPPQPPINLLGDYAGGGAVAALGIVSALFSAGRTGVGQIVDAAMIDGVALLTAKLLGLRASGLFPGPPGTNYLDGGAPYYTTYPCADGRHIAVGALEDKFYQEFLAGLGVDAHDWPDRLDRENWPALHRRISTVLLTRTRDDWAAVFLGTDACVTPVLEPDEAAVDPHNVARDMFRFVAGVLQPSPSPRFSATPARAPEAPADHLVAVAELAEAWA